MANQIYNKSITVHFQRMKLLLREFTADWKLGFLEDKDFTSLDFNQIWAPPGEEILNKVNHFIEMAIVMMAWWHKGDGGPHG